MAAWAWSGGPPTRCRRQVALKEVDLPRGVDESERRCTWVSREAWGGGPLSHPGVVTVYDIAHDGDQDFIVMELVSAPTLEELVRTRGPPCPSGPPGSGWPAGYARGRPQGRDRPPRLAEERDGPRGRRHQACRLRHRLGRRPRLTATGLVVGSPAYMAPEQVEAQAVSPATDLWALGATLLVRGRGASPGGGRVPDPQRDRQRPAAPARAPRPPGSRPGPPAGQGAEGRATPAQLRPLLRRVVAGGVAADPALENRPRRQPLGGSRRRGRRPGRPGRDRAGPRPRTRSGGASPRATRRRCPAGSAGPLPAGPGAAAGPGPAGAHAGRAGGLRRPPPPGPGPAGVRRRGRGPVRRRHLAGVPSPGTSTSGARRPRPGGRPCPPAGAASRTRTAPTGCRSRPPGRRATGGRSSTSPSRAGSASSGSSRPATACPLSAQRSLERSFVARHPGDDYRRLRLGATTFRSVPAAEWEFTFLDEGRLMRGYDITFVASGRRHAILFQAPASRWAAS